jgi:hypothetical protein
MLYVAIIVLAMAGTSARINDSLDLLGDVFLPDYLE